jgi:peptide/nickel transport system ATP-binding protein
MILRLLEVTSGTIRVDGVDVAGLKGDALKHYYGRVQGVFQDPFSCFNPIFKVDRIFTMIRDEYAPATDRAAWGEKVVASLASVALDAGQVLGKYPHQLSGGQLQRLLVARALLLDIDYLVADEISSMLDASTRIDVLNLLADLRDRGLGVLFITHDLSLGNYISSRTIILRRGAIVEIGDTAKVYGDPRHPYTKMLLECVPRLHARWTGDAARVNGAPEGPLVEVEAGHLVAACVGAFGGGV